MNLGKYYEVGKYYDQGTRSGCLRGTETADRGFRGKALFFFYAIELGQNFILFFPLSQI